jgi:hypothetical protein
MSTLQQVAKASGRTTRDPLVRTCAALKLTYRDNFKLLFVAHKRKQNQAHEAYVQIERRLTRLLDITERALGIRLPDPK